MSFGEKNHIYSLSNKKLLSLKTCILETELDYELEIWIEQIAFMYLGMYTHTHKAITKKGIWIWNTREFEQKIYTEKNRLSEHVAFLRIHFPAHRGPHLQDCGGRRGGVTSGSFPYWMPASPSTCLELTWLGESVCRF